MKCKECCGDGYNLRIIKKGNDYTTERVTCEHCHGTGEIEMTEPKLKPCPFCGGKAESWESPFCVWKVFCTECGASITLNTDENADVLWNKRVGEVAE